MQHSMKEKGYREEKHNIELFGVGKLDSPTPKSDQGKAAEKVQ